uniref:Uncharacterized protein n=1 Tax=Glossina brevipalpis TaxID=37001 RepID=A0A1A9W3L9_9MUSC
MLLLAPLCKTRVPNCGHHGRSNIILGMDFVAKHGFVPDLERQVLQYANMALPLTTEYGRDPEELQIVIEQLQEIPPNSEAILWATSNGDLGTSRTWVVEPAKNYTADTIIVGKAVVTPINNLIPVRFPVKSVVEGSSEQQDLTQKELHKTNKLGPGKGNRINNLAVENAHEADTKFLLISIKYYFCPIFSGNWASRGEKQMMPSPYHHKIL